MLLPLLFSLFGVLWTPYNAYRAWREVDARIFSRNVSTYVQSDEDNYYEHFPVTISYIYSFGGREFTSGFESEEISGTWRSTASFEEAVSQAKRHQIGDSWPIYVDANNPTIATKKRPPFVLPMLGVSLALAMALGAALAGPNRESTESCLAFIIAILLVAGATWYTRIPGASEIARGNSVLPYLEAVKAYPSLGYVPQNQLRKFDSFEDLLRCWGRPDDLWIDDLDGGRRLTLTYRHGADWSQAWSQDFQLAEGRPPLPVGQPRADHPER